MKKSGRDLVGLCNEVIEPSGLDVSFNFGIPGVCTNLCEPTSKLALFRFRKVHNAD